MQVGLGVSAALGAVKSSDPPSKQLPQSASAPELSKGGAGSASSAAVASKAPRPVAPLPVVDEVAPSPKPSKRAAALQKKKELHDCLSKLDPDGSGSISVSLLAEAMQCIGIHFSFEDLAAELLSNDKDGDGNMEVHEVDQFLDQEAALQASGLEGALEPWSIGRSLALDALPLAARAYSAHTVVEGAMNRGKPHKSDSPRRRRDSLTLSETSSKAPVGEELSAMAGAASNVKSTGTSTGTGGGQRGGVGAGSASEQAAQRERSPMFVLWEDTKAAFAQYGNMRKHYEARWPEAAWDIKERLEMRRSGVLHPSLGPKRQGTWEHPSLGPTSLGPKRRLHASMSTSALPPSAGAMYATSSSSSAGGAGGAGGGAHSTFISQRGQRAGQSLLQGRRAETRLQRDGLEPRSAVRRAAEARRAEGVLAAAIPLPPLRTDPSADVSTGGMRRPSRFIAPAAPAAPTALQTGLRKAASSSALLLAARSRLAESAPAASAAPAIHHAAAVRADTPKSSLRAPTTQQHLGPRPHTSSVHFAAPSSGGGGAPARLDPAASAPTSRPGTGDSLRREHQESGFYLGTILLSADRAADGRPSTGLSLSNGARSSSRGSSRGGQPLRGGQPVTFGARPPRLVDTVIPTAHAAAAIERKRHEEWIRAHATNLLVVEDAPAVQTSWMGAPASLDVDSEEED